MSFKDHFSGHADQYATARPTYPEELFSWIASSAPATQKVWDVGCGNGQASVALAAHFDSVLATDASDEQIAKALPSQNVEYRAAPAEKCPLPDASCDAVTVAQAAHWFDLEAFYREAKRVLKPGGLLAIWCYGIHTVDRETDAVVGTLYRETLGTDWPPERAYIEAGYSDLPFPFAQLAVPRFHLKVKWTADQLADYLSSWSATQRYIRRTGDDPVVAVRQWLRDEWVGARRCVQWPISMLAGLRPS